MANNLIVDTGLNIIGQNNPNGVYLNVDKLSVNSIDVNKMIYKIC